MLVKFVLAEVLPQVNVYANTRDPMQKFEVLEKSSRPEAATFWQRVFDFAKQTFPSHRTS